MKDLLDSILKTMPKRRKAEKPTLELAPGGKLIAWRWDFKTKKYVSRDVTASAPNYLFQMCEIRNGTTLRDLFLVINANLDVFDAVLTRWCRDFAAEILKVKRGPTRATLAYLELTKNIRVEKRRVWGTERPFVHGVGFPLRKAKIGRKPGERITYNIMATPLEELAHLPIRMNRLMTVYNNNVTSSEFHQTIAEIPNVGYTLGDILYGLIWELSYCGDPKKRVEFGSVTSEYAAEDESESKRRKAKPK